MSLIILAIGSHPDDIEIGCGGTLIIHSMRGDTIYLFIMNKGDLGGEISVRKNEQKKAGKILGAKNIFFGDISDGCTRYDLETIHKVEDIVNKTKPDIVYTHSSNDHHQDHLMANRCTISACRYVKSILFYETPSTTVFKPTLFVDITDVIDKKFDAVKAHKTQIKRKTFVHLDVITSLARYRGFQARVTYAEGFETHRYLLRY